jgi:hypothetical protein
MRHVIILRYTKNYRSKYVFLRDFLSKKTPYCPSHNISSRARHAVITEGRKTKA